MEKNKLDTLLNFFKALANENRLKILGIAQIIWIAASPLYLCDGLQGEEEFVDGMLLHRDLKHIIDAVGQSFRL